eukprot:5965619-Prymnesium_polylepis.1
MHTGNYLQLDEETGQVFANAESASADTARWQVLVLDTDTVRVLARSAQGIDARSERFTGRRMRTASGCACSGYSNAHGLGRFCHPWEDKNQEAWCYVSDNCTSAALRGSFGRRFESCDVPPEWAVDGAAAAGERTGLVPVSGCNCSGVSNSHGFGASCKGWEYDGQPPWCYLEPACAAVRGAPYGRRNGSFGRPYEECASAESNAAAYSLDGSSTDAGLSAYASSAAMNSERSIARRNRRRLSAPPRVAQLLASKPEQEQYLVLVSRHSNAFLQVEPPPHKDALLLSARADELSIRTVFSSYER